jgi:hypothetical protein
MYAQKNEKKDQAHQLLQLTILFMKYVPSSILFLINDHHEMCILRS